MDCEIRPGRSDLGDYYCAGSAAENRAQTAWSVEGTGVAQKLSSIRWTLDLCQRIHRAAGNRVAQGPHLRGLTFYGYHELPCLLGTAARENLSAAPERLAAQKSITRMCPPSGAASHGFTLPGAGRRTTQSAGLYAYEMTLDLHAHIRDNVRANAPDSRLEVFGECKIEDLASVIPQLGKPLLVVDVEGAELSDHAFDPTRGQTQLRNATLLVETHDPLRPGCTKGLLERFQESHHIERIYSAERTLDDFPFSSMTHPRFMLANAALRSMSEGRAVPQEWLVMSPR